MKQIHLANKNNSFSFSPIPFSCHREKQLNERDFDFISNWHQFSISVGIATDCHQSTKHNMMDTKNQMKDGRSQSKPHTGLLRRRHSLPEIIMRK